MISTAVVNRYANALADVVLAPQAGSNDAGVEPAQVVEQLRSFDEAVASVPALRSVLTSPAIPVARKRAVIKSIAEKLGLAKVVCNFVLVVSDHRRSEALAQIVEAFEELLDSRLGFVRAEVHSAFELNGEQQNQLSGQLAHLAGAEVRMRFVVQPELIGGVTAKIGSSVYDGSVRGQLAEMRKRLSAVR
jgi:F-type H+-transporting ATPase subunit delta